MIDEEKFVFQYVFWQIDKNNHKKYSWNVALCSIILCRYVYKKSSIQLIMYTKADEKLKSFAKLLNFEIIEIENYYIKRNEDNFNCLQDAAVFFLSKPMDAIQIAEKSPEKFYVLLDIDFFIFNKFEGLQLEKIGVLFFDKIYCHNTGLLTYSPKTDSVFLFKTLYKSLLVAFNQPSSIYRKKMEWLAYENDDPSLQEEAIVKIMFKKFPELIGDIFYDLDYDNHNLYIPRILKNYPRNMHTQSFNKDNIVNCFLNSTYFLKVLEEICTEEIKEFLLESRNEICDDESINLINCLNASAMHLKKIPFEVGNKGFLRNI